MFNKQSTFLRKVISPPPQTTRSGQFGAAAIEFALAFPLLFALFYAIVGYSLVLTIQQSMTQASKEGIRAAIRADRTAFPNTAAYQAKVIELARSAAGNSLTWLPDTQKSLIIGSSPSYDKVGVSITDSTITVTLTYPYTEAPLLPVLSLPLIGDVPNIPSSFVIRSDGLL